MALRSLTHWNMARGRAILPREQLTCLFWVVMEFPLNIRHSTFTSKIFTESTACLVPVEVSAILVANPHSGVDTVLARNIRRGIVKGLTTTTIIRREELLPITKRSTHRRPPLLADRKNPRHLWA